MQNPAVESGVAKLWGRQEGPTMALSMLFLLLILLRTRRTKLKIEIDL
jgi:hypothetical protein